MRNLAILAFAVAAFAVTPAVAKEKAAADPNKKFCRHIDVTSSILPKSVCHTAAEWAKIDDANNEAARQVGTMRSGQLAH